MRKVADSEETVVRIPVIIPPIEVQLVLRVILVEVRDVPIAVHLCRGTLCRILSGSPLLVYQPMRLSEFEVESYSQY